MPLVKIYLDNNPMTTEPSNISDLEEVIERDENIRGLLPKYPTVLKFSGDCYDYIKSVYDDNGFCSEIDIVIQTACNDIFTDYFTGKIFVSAVTFNLSKCTCECQVSDNNYGALIFQNKNIKANVNAPFSKMGVPVSPISLYEIDNFAPGDCTSVSSFYGVDVYKLFTFLVEFMSEGAIDFDSDFIRGWDDDKHFVVTVGKALRVGNSITAPIINVSFQELFVEINKKFNISFAMELQANGRYLMRIENVDYFYKTGKAFSKRYIQDLLLVFSGELLYSQILVGSSDTVSDPSEYSFPAIAGMTHREESYYIQTTCNKENELNLLSDWIIDTNMIEAICLDITLTDSDEKIFLVQYTESTRETTHDQIIPGICTYNTELLNYKVVDRWQVGGAVAKYLSDGEDDIIVEKTDNIPATPYPGSNGTSSPVAFTWGPNIIDYQTEILDLNNNWTSSNRFTSPADGVYAFESVFNMTVVLLTSDPGIGELNRNSQIVLDLYLELFDDTNVSRGSYRIGYANFTEYVYSASSSRQVTTVSGITLTGGSAWELSNGALVTATGNSGNITMPSGWYVQPVLYGSGSIARNSAGSFTAGLNSTLQTTFILNGGGVLKPADMGSYRVANISFDDFVSVEEWADYKNELANMIMVGVDNNANTGTWTKKISRNLKTGKTKFELITNTDNL